MVRKLNALLLLLLFVSLLQASNSASIIKEADALLSQHTKNSYIKARNLYKSAYLKALLNDEEHLANRALKGVNEAKKRIHNFKEKKPKIDKNIQSTSNQNYLQKYNLNSSVLTLAFKYPIELSRIKTFPLHGNGVYRQVIDIPAIFDPVKASPKSSYFKNIVISQYNKTTTRVVLTKGLNFSVSLKVDTLKLIIKATTTSNQTSVNNKIESPTINNTNLQQLNRHQKLILIDPGHGGKDSGAVGYKKIMEKEVVLAVSKLVSKELRKRGYKTKLTRSKDRFIKLKERTKIANRINADLFISIHANSTASKKIHAKGIESYFLSPARSERAKSVAAIENSVDLQTMNDISQNTFLSFLNRTKVIESNKLAIDIQKNLLTSLQSKYNYVKDNGVREAPFWVLVGAQMPAVLIEIGFITNPLEAKRMKTKKYQTQLAKGIANGIDNYFYHN